MKDTKLTLHGPDATPAAMQRHRHRDNIGVRGKSWVAATMIAGTGVLGGCVTVNAPDKPIVIELNINIRQEVIYRLAEDAGNTIDENAAIF